MNRRFYFGLAIAMTALAAWAGRLAWRAHKNLVSLQVRNMPLADVIRRLERQTWERIVTDSRLDTKVTLTVDDMPLSDVLDRVAEQAGGLVTAVHAIHKSRPALDKLVAGLRSGDFAKAPGWTNVAPRPFLFDGDRGAMNLLPAPLGEKGVGRQEFEVDRRVVVRRGVQGAGPGSSESAAPFIQFRGIRGGNGEAVQEEIVPERIVMETRLEPRLKAETPLAPNREAAREAARQVGGRLTTLYSIRKSAVGALGVGTMRKFRSEFSSVEPGRAGKAQAKRGPPPFAEAEREAQRANLSRFLNLTPEQRAQRARERQQQNFPPQ